MNRPDDSAPRRGRGLVRRLPALFDGCFRCLVAAGLVWAAPLPPDEWDPAQRRQLAASVDELVSELEAYLRAH